MTFFTKDDIKSKWVDNKDPHDICIFYHDSIDAFMCFNKDEIKLQMCLWKKLLISGDIYVFDQNCKTKTINGVQYYLLVIQGNNIQEIAKSGLVFDNESFIVSGLIYMFKSKQNRDDVFKWLSKFNQITLPPNDDDDDEKLCCDICMDEKEECFKSSCCNQNICNICIKRKKLNSCPFCRKEF